MTINLTVTQERFDEVFSIDDWLYFGELSNREKYDKMLFFVADEQGQYVTKEEARKLFKTVPKKDWTEKLLEFYKAVENAFVNPTKGNGSTSP